jgi:hypothetical protein
VAAAAAGPLEALRRHPHLAEMRAQVRGGGAKKVIQGLAMGGGGGPALAKAIMANMDEFKDIMAEGPKL